jgi:hypothetical protein
MEPCVSAPVHGEIVEEFERFRAGGRNTGEEKLKRLFKL